MYGFLSIPCSCRFVLVSSQIHFAWWHLLPNDLTRLPAGMGEAHSETRVIEIHRSILADGAKPRPSGGTGVRRNY
jgi:hypothetical protein